MNYRHAYMAIICHAKSEEKLGLRPKNKADKRRYFSDKYFEFHHILPKSLFPNWIKRKSNIVCLTAREHFFCHQLLTKIWPGIQMYGALAGFLRCRGDTTGRILTSRQYEIARKAVSLMNLQKSKDSYKKSAQKATITRKLKYEKLSEKEKLILHMKRSETGKQAYSSMSEDQKRKSIEKALSTKAKNPEKQRIAHQKSGEAIRRLFQNEAYRKEFCKKMKYYCNLPTWKRKVSENTKKAFKRFKKERPEEYKRMCEKLSESRKGEKNPAFGMHWWTNGIENIYCKSNTTPPKENFHLGYTQTKSKRYEEGRKKFAEFGRKNVRSKAVFYRKYKSAGGKLDWNEFQKAFKIENTELILK